MDKKGLKLLFIFICFVCFTSFLHAKEYDNVREIIIDPSETSKTLDVSEDAYFRISIDYESENFILRYFLINKTCKPLDYSVIVEAFNDSDKAVEPNYYRNITHGADYSWHYSNYIKKFKVTVKYNNFEDYKTIFPDENYIILEQNIRSDGETNDGIIILEHYKILKIKDNEEFFYRRIPTVIVYDGKEYNNIISLDDSIYSNYEYKIIDDYYEFKIPIEDTNINETKIFDIRYVLRTKNELGEYIISEHSNDDYITKYLSHYYHNTFISNVSCELNHTPLDNMFDYDNYFCKGNSDPFVCKLTIGDMPSKSSKSKLRGVISTVIDWKDIIIYKIEENTNKLINIGICILIVGIIVIVIAINKRKK